MLVQLHLLAQLFVQITTFAVDSFLLPDDSRLSDTLTGEPFLLSSTGLFTPSRHII